MRVFISAGLLSLATSGCLSADSIASEPQGTQPCPAVLVQRVAAPNCVQIEGSDVGRLPLEVRLGDRTIHFAEWTQVDEVSTDVIGFAAHMPGDVVYAVKAGDQYYSGKDPRWLHPAGITGPRVHRIEAVTFCHVLASRCGATPVMVDAASGSKLGAVARR